MDYKKIVGVLIVISLLYFFRPWFHPVVMYFYKNPIVIEVVLIWAVIHFLFFRVPKKKKGKGVALEELAVDTFQSPYLIISAVILLFLLLFASFFSNYIVLLELPHTLEYNKIQSLPESTTNLRLMPIDVAKRYARDSLQLAQYKLGTQNIINSNGSLSWVFPLVPDGALLQFLLKNKGIVIVDATIQEKNSKIIEKDLEIGEEMQIFDNLYWNLYKKKYFVDVEDSYYIYKNGDVYTIVPAISYEYRSYWGLLYAIPKFAGLFIVDSKGNIKFLTPEQALQSNLLQDNRIFPETLSRLYVESYAFKNGLINYLFIHKDQIKVQDIPGYEQPFLLDTKDGLKWFISTEPYGESHGVFKIFLIDARTGKINLLELEANKTLTGPVKAADFVRKSNPIVDWTRFRFAEPLPFFKNNSLYWKIVVIPRDAAGIAYQAFVNAETNEVIELHTEEEILSFVRGKELKDKKLEEEEEDIVEQIKQKIAEIEDLLKKLEEK
jgi:hypothetical protein